MRSNLILLIVLLLAGRACGATYYIDATNGLDTNDGTAAVTGGGHGPWQTIDKIGLSMATFVNGDTVQVRTGTYASTGVNNLTKNLTIQNYPGESVTLTAPAAANFFSWTAGTETFSGLTFTGGAANKAILTCSNVGTALVLTDTTFSVCASNPVSATNVTVTATGVKTIDCTNQWLLTGCTLTASRCYWLRSGNSAANPSTLRMVTSGAGTFQNCTFLGGYTSANGCLHASGAAMTFNDCLFAGAPWVGTTQPILLTDTGGTMVWNNSIINGHASLPNTVLTWDGVTQNNCLNNIDCQFAVPGRNDAIFTFIAYNDAWAAGSEYLTSYSAVFDTYDVHMSFCPDDAETFTGDKGAVALAFYNAGHDLGWSSRAAARLDKNTALRVSYVGANANPRVIVTYTDEDTAGLQCVTDSGTDLDISIAKGSTYQYIGSTATQGNSVWKTINDLADWDCTYGVTQDMDDAYAFCLAADTYAVSTLTALLFDMDRWWDTEITGARADIAAVVGEGWQPVSLCIPYMVNGTDTALVARLKEEVGCVGAITRFSTTTPISLASINDVWDMQVVENFSLSTLRGTGYDDLTAAEKEARVRSGVRVWALMARTYGLWQCSLFNCLDTSPTGITATELGWMLDEMIDNGVRVLSFAEAIAYIASTSTPNGDGYTRSFGAEDLHRQSGSQLIKAGAFPMGGPALSQTPAVFGGTVVR